LSLLNQMTNLINVFYIVAAILQFIPAIATNSPYASLIPVVWVICVNMIFELVADIRRNSQDNKDNRSIVEQVCFDSESGKEKP
jgi:hypothetical protein